MALIVSRLINDEGNQLDYTWVALVWSLWNTILNLNVEVISIILVVNGSFNDIRDIGKQIFVVWLIFIMNTKFCNLFCVENVISRRYLKAGVKEIHWLDIKADICIYKPVFTPAIIFNMEIVYFGTGFVDLKKIKRTTTNPFFSIWNFIPFLKLLTNSFR